MAGPELAVLTGKRSPSAAATLWRRWAAIAAGLAALVGAEAWVYLFVRSQGVTVTGDEPHYMIVAKSLLHSSVHPLKAYQSDLLSHQFYDWPPGTTVRSPMLPLYPGPHGPVGGHGLGLSVLLVPFVAAGRTGAVLGLMALQALGTVYLFVRFSKLVGLTGASRVVFGLALVGPAVLIAGTQVYPDLIAGTLMACALAGLVTIERTGRAGGGILAVATFSVGFLPWLHPKNFPPAAVIGAAILYVGIRARLGRAVWVATSVFVMSWLLLLIYNQYEFGHWMGLPQAMPSPNRAGFELFLGLLVDRHQGLFIQAPVAVLGLAGLWLARRWTPVGALATGVAVLSVLYLNATYFFAPYGADTLAGRFQWSSLMPLLGWSSVAVGALQRSRVRLWAVGGIIAALWIVEWIPILGGHHVYYNQAITGPPWRLSSYSGWWGRFDGLLPVFLPSGRWLGWPRYGLPFVLVILVSVSAVAMVGSGQDERRRPGGCRHRHVDRDQYHAGQ